MHEHHRRAMEKAVARLAEEPDVRLVLLGGSIAKGIERPDSDVDLMVVVDDDAYADRLARNAVGFLWWDVADWPGGYAEGRFLARGFVLAAAERGSEPTRWSFTGARPVWGIDPEIEAALPRIPVYPEADRDRRIDAFLAQMTLHQRYFWSEGVRRNDPYLLTRAATAVILFGVRLVLAHNRVLFPNQKRLMETLGHCPERPDGLEALVAPVLRGDETARDAFCAAVNALIGPRDADLLSRCLQDSEMGWYNGSPDVAEW